MCPDTDDSGVPISCASWAASCPSVASRTFEALSRRMSLSSRFSCAERHVLLGQIVRRLLDLGAEALVESADLRVCLGEPFEHPVESFRQATHLVQRLDGNASREIALLHVPHRRRQHLQRLADHPLGDEARDQRQADDEHDREDDRDLLLGLQHRLDRPQRPPHVQRRFPRTLQVDVSSMGCSCDSPGVGLAGEAERLADERREAGDLRAIAPRRDDAAGGCVGLPVHVEIEPHDPRVAVEVTEQLLLQRRDRRRRAGGSSDPRRCRGPAPRRSSGRP